MLQPDAFTLEVFAYVLAVAAERTGVLVHAICVMANHYHAVVTDPFGRIAEFYHYLHEFTSKALNAKRGRWENMWACTETSRVSLEDRAAVIDKITYTLTNPVSSHVLAHARKWPGLRRWWNEGPLEVQRPSVFFRKNGPTPPTATLTLVPPPQLASEPDGGVALMTRTLSERETWLRAEARKKGRKYVGLKNIKAQKWWESPTTFATRRGLSPRVATRDKWRRIEALARNKQFEADHAEARKQWLAGDRLVLWPAGTYLMRVRHNVPCRPPPG